MSDVPEGPSASGVLAWVVPIVVGAGFIWAIVKGFFELVTRKELKEHIAAQDAKFLEQMQQLRKTVDASFDTQRRETLRLHNDNKATASETFGRLSELEKTVSRVDGTVSGLYQSLPARLKRRPREDGG